MKPYFVMMMNQKGTLLVPLMDSLMELAMFETIEEARLASDGTFLGRELGYEIFEAGDGV